MCNLQVACSIEAHDGLCRALADQAKAIVVSVGYRLAPEHKFPAALDDCYAALLWAAEHAAGLGADGSRIAVGGDSAGGALAAAVTMLARERGGPKLCYQLLIYPAVDASMRWPSKRYKQRDSLLTPATMLFFWKSYSNNVLGDMQNPLMCPYQAASLAGLPPACVVTAEYDLLRDEGQAYAARLSQEGVRTKHVCYKGMLHGFMSQCFLIEMPPGTQAVSDCAAALQDAFAGCDPEHRSKL